MTDRFRTDVDWEDLRFFAAVARRGSLSAAARALGVNHATVSRRVAAIEAALGARLLERRPSGYAPTARGRDALEAVAGMEAAASAIGRDRPADAIAGLVRITATPSLADWFLLPCLSQLQQSHPALDLELVADSRALSLPRHEADLALRLARPRDGGLIARRVATLGYGFYASRDVAARIAAGAPPNFVGFDEGNAHVPEAAFLTRHFPRTRLRFRTNSQIAQAAAARDGWGIAMLPRFLGAADARLTPVAIEPVPPDRDLWLLMRRDGAHAPPVRVVADFLAGALKQASAAF